MMILISLAAATLPCGAVAADLKKGKPFIDRQSGRPLSEISGCISEAWQSRSGQTTYIPTAKGFTMRLSYPVVSTMLIAAQIEAEDLGDQRAVKVFARKGDRSKKLEREVEGCL